MCDDYESEGVCIKRVCNKRHLKTCKYWRRGHCYRGESCQFAHQNLKSSSLTNDQEVVEIDCEKCGKKSSMHYYCESWGKTFCSKCTVKQAHDELYSEQIPIMSCKDIHESVNYKENDNNSTKIEDVENCTQKCQCGKESNTDLFECEDCEQHFCDKCSMYPLMGQPKCLKCMVSEIVTSTPDK